MGHFFRLTTTIICSSSVIFIYAVNGIKTWNWKIKCGVFTDDLNGIWSFFFLTWTQAPGNLLQEIECFSVKNVCICVCAALCFNLYSTCLFLCVYFFFFVKNIFLCCRSRCAQFDILAYKAGNRESFKTLFDFAWMVWNLLSC